MKFLCHLTLFLLLSVALISCAPSQDRVDSTDTDTEIVTDAETGAETLPAGTDTQAADTADESEPASGDTTTDASTEWPGGTFLCVRQAPSVIALGELNAELGVEEIGNDADKLLYDVEVVVTDPEIVEIVAVDKYAIFDCGMGDVVLRGLKEGSTTLILKHIYKATGAYQTTVIPLTVEDLTVSEDETIEVVDTSDVWEVFFTQTNSDRVYTIKEGEVFDRFQVEFRCVDCKHLWHSSNCSYDGIKFSYEDYRFDVATPNDGVVEILSCDKYAVMNTCKLGGIAVKGLAEGMTPLQLTMTHIPTGKTVMAEVTVVVKASSDL